MQIHKYKYKNTALVKIADRHAMCYIFEKVKIPGHQKHCSRVPDLQIHKFKYTNTNTHIHKYSIGQIHVKIHKYKYTNTSSAKVADMPNMLYFLEGNKAEAHKFQNGKRRIRTAYSV